MGESSSKSKRLGPVGLLAGIALLLVVMIGCGLLGIVVSGGPRNQPNAPIGIFGKMNYIGDRLEAWREHPTAGWPTQQASGFLVSQHQ